MRGLAHILRRGRASASAEPLELTTSDMRSPEVADATWIDASVLGEGRKPLHELAQEVDQVAAYVARLKREISALKPGEICQKRIPATRDDLRDVEAATKAAVDRIIAVAEALMTLQPSTAGERATLEEHAIEIMEACSFQDLAGQRLQRAAHELGALAKRFERFRGAVRIPDAGDLIDREAIVREARREILLVEGPQSSAETIEQGAVDKLFD